MKNFPVLIESLLYSAAGLLFQVVVLSMVEGDALALGTTLLFLAPLANGVILAIAGEPLNVYGIRGSAALIKATIAALAISMGFVIVGILWTSETSLSSIAVVLMAAIVAQQVVGPVRRVCYQSTVVWLSVGGCLLLLILSLLCLSERLSPRVYMIGSSLGAIALCALVIANERGRGGSEDHSLAKVARSYGVPLLPSALFAWVPIGVSGLAISLASSAQDAAYFKGVINLIVPVQVLIAANQTRLISAGEVPALGTFLRSRNLVLGTFFCCAIFLVCVPWIYEFIYRKAPRTDIYLVTATLMVSMVLQAGISLLGARCRLAKRTDRVSAGYGVGALVSLPAIAFAYMGASPVAGATAAMLGSAASLAYLWRVDRC